MDMTYVKYFIITFIIAVGLGFVLASAQQNKEYETALEIKDKTTGGYVEFEEVKIFPNKKERYDERLTGKGRKIYDTDLFTLAYVTVQAKGYETKRTIQFWNASKENIVLLDRLEGYVFEDDNKEAGKIEEINETEVDVKEDKVKVDLLPKIK